MSDGDRRLGRVVSPFVIKPRLTDRTDPKPGAAEGEGVDANLPLPQCPTTEIHRHLHLQSEGMMSKRENYFK
jgi:hypothetical protein